MSEPLICSINLYASESDVYLMENGNHVCTCYIKKQLRSVISLLIPHVFCNVYSHVLVISVEYFPKHD